MIKNQKVFSAKKISIIYKFNGEIDHVYNCMKDFDLTQTYFPDLRDKAKFLKGTNTYTIDNEFSLNWCRGVILNFKVIEKIEEKSFKKISWNVNVNNTNIEYKYTYSFHYITLEKSTLLIWEIFYDKVKFPFTQNMLKDYHKLLLDQCIRYEHYIKNNYEFLTTSDSIVIRGDRNKIWEILSSVQKLGETFPENFGVIKPAINKSEANTYTFYNSIRKISYEISVLKIVSENYDSKWIFKFSIKNTNKEDYFPKHIMKVSILEISPNVNLVIFKNDFEENVNINFIYSLKMERISTLQKFKKYFEI